jgi:hypothetical protein
MKLFLGTSFVILFHLLVSAQNPSYFLMHKNVLSNENYEDAKSHYIEFSAKYSIDPAQTYLFLYKSLSNNDISFFKKKMSQLIIESGKKYTQIDSVQEIDNGEFIQLMQSKGLIEWAIQTSTKNHLNWVKKNYEVLPLIELGIKLNAVNYSLKKFQHTFNFNPDEINFNDSVYNSLQFKNIEELAKFCEVFNTYPNSFDHGLTYASNFDQILLQNLKIKANFFKTWELLSPYIEKKYLEGKLSFMKFVYYDQMSVRHFGYQFYGTLENVECFDIQTTNTLRERLQLGSIQWKKD